MFEFYVPGSPVAARRPRFWRSNVVDDQKNRKFVVKELIKEQFNQSKMIKGPVKLEIEFYFPMGDSLTPTEKKQRRNNPHFFKPDLSNLVKFYEDIMSKLVFKDDCQIAHIVCRKTYADVPHTKIYLTPLSTDQPIK